MIEHALTHSLTALYIVTARGKCKDQEQYSANSHPLSIAGSNDVAEIADRASNSLSIAGTLFGLSAVRAVLPDQYELGDTGVEAGT